MLGHSGFIKHEKLPFIFLMLMGFFFGLIFPFIGFDKLWIPSVSGIITLSTLFLFLLLLIWTDKRKIIFHPLYFIGVNFLIGTLLRSIYIVFISSDIMVGFSTPTNANYLWRALVLSCIGFFFLGLGFLTGFGRKAASILPALPSETNKKRLLSIMVFYGVIGVTAYLLFLSSIGAKHLSWSYISIPRKGGNNVLLVLSRLSYVAAFISLLFFGKYRRNKTLIFIIITSALLISFISNSRSDILGVLIVLTVLFNYLIKKLSGKQLLSIIMFLIILSVSMLGFRNVRQTGTFEIHEIFTFENIFSKLLISRDFADVTTFTHVVRHVDNTSELLVGSTYLRAFSNFVPRRIWGNKPKSFGVYAFDIFYENYLGPSNTGVPLSIIGELYWNFHVIGLVFGMVLLGFFSRVLYEYFLMHRNNSWVILIYGITLYYLFEETRVYFSVAFPRYLFLLVPTVFALVLTSRYFVKIQRR